MKKEEKYLRDILKLKNNTINKLFKLTNKHNSELCNAVQDYKYLFNDFADSLESIIDIFAETEDKEDV